MKTQFLTFFAYVLTAGWAMGAATPLDSQEYSDAPNIWCDLGGFSNVQFKSNGSSPGYDSNSPNLLENANNFSISLEEVTFSPLDTDIAPSGYNAEFAFIASLDAYGHGLWVGLTYSESDKDYCWTISQSDGLDLSDATYSSATTGVVFDYEAGGTYIFRSGADFMDLWRVVNGVAYHLVTHNEALDGALYSYGNSEAFLGDGYDGVADILFGQDGTEFVSYSNPTLYNGLYDANGVGSQTPSIPEPASATLSLLALAGLAARRRRK